MKSISLSTEGAKIKIARIFLTGALNLNVMQTSCGLFSFHQALDCFTAMLSRPESRLRMAEIIGSKLNISKEKVCNLLLFYHAG